MFTCCCGVGSLHGLMHKKKIEMADCWHETFYADLTGKNGQYRIPKTGYYALSISSFGADVHDARNKGVGTAFYVGQFAKNDVIRYALGNPEKNFSSQAFFSNTQLNSLVRGTGSQYAAFNIRWLGDGSLMLPARLVGIDEIRIHDPLQNNGYAFCHVFPDGTDVFSLNNNQVFTISHGDWAKMPANIEHWYVQDVPLSQTGTYTVYALGDDVQRFALNGIPVAWSESRVASADCAGRQQVGTFQIDKADVYRFIVMQVNIPIDTPSWSAVVVRAPDGSVLDLIGNWRYLKNTHDCGNKTDIPASPVNPPTDNPVNPPTDNPVNPPTDNPVNPPTDNPVNPPKDTLPDHLPKVGDTVNGFLGMKDCDTGRAVNVHLTSSPVVPDGWQSICYPNLYYYKVVMSLNDSVPPFSRQEKTVYVATPEQAKQAILAFYGRDKEVKVSDNQIVDIVDKMNGFFDTYTTGQAYPFGNQSIREKGSNKLWYAQPTANTYIVNELFSAKPDDIQVEDIDGTVWTSAIPIEVLSTAYGFKASCIGINPTLPARFQNEMTSIEVCDVNGKRILITRLADGWWFSQDGYRITLNNVGQVEYIAPLVNY